MTRLKFALLLIASLIALPAAAGPDGDAFATCLADNTTGKERKELARWIFLAMASHPEIRALSNATAADRDRADRMLGALLTRLVSENCAPQARAAVQNEGSESFKSAFRAFGQSAMLEIMSDQGVRDALSGFERYADRKKIEAALGTK